VRPKEREEAVRRYVLGTSPEAEAAALDEEIARGGDEPFEELEAVEADLLDAYAAGELSARERREVEETYGAVAAGRRRLAFAAALRRKAANTPAVRRSPPAWLPLAAVIALAVLGIAALVWRDHQLRGELGRSHEAHQAAKRQAERLAREVETSQTEVARLRRRLEQALRVPPIDVPPLATTLAQLVLRPGLLREPGATPEIELTPALRSIELVLELPTGGYEHYRVAVETPDGNRLWQSGRLIASTRGGKGVVTARLPAGPLADGTYVVTVTGWSANGVEEPAAEYSFRARRRR
jgi:hypothetical protein